MAEKTLKCDDLTYLEDLELFKNEVAFKIRQPEYTVKESYMEYKGLDENGLRVITDSKEYMDNITDYTYKFKVDDNFIQTFKGNGPAIFTYLKPAINSTKYIINRESKSIGYQISTGDIKNCTKLVTHVIFDKKTEEFSRITTEFFKGDDKCGENPYLNMLNEIRMTGTEGIYLLGVETRTMFDKDGNIENYLVGNGKYAYTNTGDFICVNMEYTYSSTPDNRSNIIPRCKFENDVLKVEFYQKAFPHHVLSEEVFKEDTENECLILLSTHRENAETRFYYRDDNTISYIHEFTSSENNHYSVSGTTNCPLSADFFMFDEYQKNITFGKNPYFDNIYQSNYFNDAMLTHTTIENVTIGDESGVEIASYQYKNAGLCYFSQKYIDNHSSESKELCKYKEGTLNNGNIVIESVIAAEPSYPRDPKSIFYRCVELDKVGKNIVSDYKALVVLHKER